MDLSGLDWRRSSLFYGSALLLCVISCDGVDLRGSLRDDEVSGEDDLIMTSMQFLRQSSVREYDDISQEIWEDLIFTVKIRMWQ